MRAKEKISFLTTFRSVSLTQKQERITSKALHTFLTYFSVTAEVKKHIISQKDLPHEHKSQGSNGDYPEISFTFIYQVIEGMMGISVNAFTGEIFVTPCLPEEIAGIRLFNLNFGDYSADIFIENNEITVHNHGKKPLIYKSLFDS